MMDFLSNLIFKVILLIGSIDSVSASFLSRTTPSNDGQEPFNYMAYRSQDPELAQQPPLVSFVAEEVQEDEKKALIRKNGQELTSQLREHLNNIMSGRYILQFYGDSSLGDSLIPARMISVAWINNGVGVLYHLHPSTTGPVTNDRHINKPNIPFMSLADLSATLLRELQSGCGYTKHFGVKITPDNDLTSVQSMLQTTLKKDGEDDDAVWRVSFYGVDSGVNLASALVRRNMMRFGQNDRRGMAVYEFAPENQKKDLEWEQNASGIGSLAQTLWMKLRLPQTEGVTVSAIRL